MARKASGSMEWRPTRETWVGRIRDASGVRTSWLSLGTDDETLARERLDRWIATGEAPREAGKELFAAAAERVVARMEAKSEKGAQNRRHRLQTFALPVIGHIEVGNLEPHHVYSVLDRMGQQEGATREKYAADTVHHMRVDISRVLTELVREGVLKHNIARDVELPDDLEVDDRPRVVLTDEEILRFRRRGFDSELDMMALVARDLGGHRTSDLHAADYADFDTADWKTCVVRRPKTDREGSRKGKRKGRRRATRSFIRVRIAIPETVVGPLKAWWEKAGKPASGPLFPVRRGPNAGKRKTGKGFSYAEPLRDALWAEGIVRPLPGYETAMGDERRKFCALQVDTDETRAVDFHSFRRAFVTALAKAGVNLQTAMLASGHGDASTHGRYLAPDVVTVPTAALPMAATPAPAPTDHPGSAGQPTKGTSLQPQKLSPALPPAGAPAQPWEGAAAGASATATACASDPPSDARLGQEPRSTPGADLPGAHLPAAPGIAEVLAQLVVLLQGGAGAGLIDPQRGSNGLIAGLNDPRISEGYQRRARVDSNHRPTAPEGAWAVTKAQKLGETDPPAPPVSTPSDGVLTQSAGQSPGQPAPLESPAVSGADHATEPTSSEPAASTAAVPSPAHPVAAPAAGPVITSPPSPFEMLRATARAAYDEGNWVLFDSLRPLIEAEERRAKSASAPVSLEVIRAKREGGK